MSAPPAVGCSVEGCSEDRITASEYDGLCYVHYCEQRGIDPEVLPDIFDPDECSRGHAMTPGNTVVYSGYRRCVLCKRHGVEDAALKRRARKLGAA